MRSRNAALALIVLVAGPSLGEEPPRKPMLTARLVHPNREAERVIALFRGSRASDPAAALAAWKRASREPKRLGKPLEAAIAAINPRMAGELRSLDGARLVVGPWVEGSPPRWFATLPHDDGTFAALASAFVLTGGAEEPPFDGVALDRLGPPGSALMARGPRGLVVAAMRGDLEAALKDPAPPAEIPGDARWPMRVEIHPDAIPPGVLPALALPLRALRAARSRALAISSGLEGTASHSVLVNELETALASAPLAIDPAWLDLVPREGVVAAVAFALDPGGWDALFALADRFEKEDPARADLAPARLRLGLLARAVGVRLEAEVLPHLRGISGWAGTSPGGAIDRGLVAAHFDDEAAAIRVAASIRPNKSIRVGRRGRSVLVGWGDGPIRASLDALDRAAPSAGPILRAGWEDSPPARAGGFWPGRFRGLAPEGSPLAMALGESPPVVWSGRNPGSNLEDHVRWEGLDATVRRFLDLIPLDPPPDR